MLGSDWSPENEWVSSPDITNSPNTDRILAAPRAEQFLLPTQCTERVRECQPGDGLQSAARPWETCQLCQDTSLSIVSRVESSECRPIVLTVATKEVFSLWQGWGGGSGKVKRVKIFRQ